MLDRIRTKIILTYIFHRYSGFESERQYWQWVLSDSTQQRENLRFDPQIRSMIFPYDLFTYLPEKARILEIGSGPVSDLAWGVEKGIITVIAVDPLADEYAKILNALGKDYPIRPIKRNTEQIDRDLGLFDAVYMRNSLDHTENPKRVLFRASKLLKQDGILYIAGNINEGSKNHWLGLHQYNLIIEDNRLVAYTKKRHKLDLLKNLPFKPIFCNTQINGRKGLMTIIFRKQHSKKK